MILFATIKGHDCEELPVEPRVYKPVKCLHCDMVGKHKCNTMTCRHCRSLFARDTWDHRCLIVEDPQTKKFLKSPDEVSPASRGPYGLFAWDCESRFENVHTDRIQYKFTVVDGIYTGESEVVTFMQKHVVNYVVFKNVYTGEGGEFEGDDCLLQMLHWLMAYNGGKNILVAHNSSGYDARLLFQVAKNLTSDIRLSPIMNGQKFMALRIGKLRFLDSMLHVKGSLANLAKGYNAVTEKGYFPYLFNTAENWEYSGELPAREYFDLATSAKSADDYVKFEEWYTTYQGPYIFKDEMKKYCRNDVDILATIVRGYDACCMKLYDCSPWFYSTAPGFNKSGCIQKLTKWYELPPKMDESYAQKVAELIPKSWVNLKPQEYWSVKAALRGGRTNISCMLRTLTQQELDMGWRICYQDVNSLYPSEQYFRDFPVGIPTIHVFNWNWKPCISKAHRNLLRCDCNNFKEIGGVKTVFHGSLFSTERIRQTHGFIHCSVRPPKGMVHPLLVTFDEEKKKSLATLREEDYKEKVFTSAELHEAMDNGYVITELHRIDEYKMSSDQWPDLIAPLYVEKTINSSNPPEPWGPYIQKLRDYIPDIADMIQKAKDEGRFKKDNAMKLTAKIAVNSGWGKHAQRANMPQNFMLHHESEMNEISDLFTNCVNGEYEFIGANSLNDNRTMYTILFNKTRDVDVHSYYIPTAVFVPSYGRLTLWRELNKLGDRVLMCDTDSIVYIWKPDEYNIPEGDMLGQWSIEDIDSKHGGIVEFVGLGPKTYSCKARDGTTLVKAKGISLKHSTTGIVNHAAMVKHAKDYLETGVINDFRVPSMTFEGNVNTGLATSRFFKEFGIRPDEFKGNLVGNYFYPFGFD